MKRGISFSCYEDVAICNAWSNTIKDNLDGNKEPFENRLFQKYAELTGDQNVRSKVSVRSRWRQIMIRCRKFHECLTEVENKQEKELTESDKVLQANMLYLEEEKKSFALSHCWTILQHTKKWQDLTKVKKSSPQTMTTNSDMRSSFFSQSEQPNPAIPIETDKDETHKDESHIEEIDTDETDKDPDYATELRRVEQPTERAEEGSDRKRKLEGRCLESRFCKLIEQLSHQWAESDKRRASIAERKLRIMEEMNEREKLAMDDKIMSMDTSKMDQCARSYYEQRKNDIYVKLMARGKDTSNLEPQKPRM